MIWRFRSGGLGKILLNDAPPLVVALTVAELFFKFGSFTAECVAFLGLWFLLDFFYKSLLSKSGRDIAR